MTGNDGGKWTVVVASSGVPRWQKVPIGSSGKATGKPAAMKTVKKAPAKKKAVAKAPVKKKLVKKAPVKKRPSAAVSKVVMKAMKAMSGEEAAALEVCRKLAAGELRVSDLGRTPETRGYVLLRDLVPQWLSKKAHKDAACRHGEPGDDPAVVLTAHVVGVMVDGPFERKPIYQILFSSKGDRQWFSVGVENGHFIRDGANQFRKWLSKRFRPGQPRLAQLRAEMASRRCKILEDLLCDFSGLPGATLAK